MRYGRLAAVACALIAGSCAPAAMAAPATTVERTVQDCDGDQLLETAFGEPHVPFPADEPAGPCPRSQRQPLHLPPSASIVNFLQLSDFQTVDEESPARVEWLDATQRIPGLQPFNAAYRPQESLSTQIIEAMVRQARNTVSPVTSRHLDLTIVTGDNADSQQFNETRWFIDILDGTTGPANPDPEMDPSASQDRKIDPNSGVPAPGCEATPGSIYDGVRDNGQSGVFPDFGYYEPDSSTGARDDGDGYSPFRAENVAETPGSDVTVRDWPGLLERANERFEALGLGMPWYSTFGNHDALVQGNSPDAFVGPVGPGAAPSPEATEVYNAAYHALATGCVKVLQPAAPVLPAIQPLIEEIQNLREGGVTPPEQSDIDRLTGEALAIVENALLHPCNPETDAGCAIDIVPPDARRCFLPKDEPNVTPAGSPCSTGSWIAQHFRTTGTPVGHGFANRPPEAQRNNDGYYAFSPKPGLRFIVLDTITDECGTLFCSDGSVDDTQFQWLRDEITSAEAGHQYVLVFSHHTLRTTRLPSTDASEQPIHFGEALDRRGGQPLPPSPGETLEQLFCEHPAVLAHVAGHEHENYVERHDCADDSPPTPGSNPYFWHISTAAHIDWPQQARMIELVNLGGQMSFVLTMLDHAGPANPGGPPEQADQGHAPGDVVRLASIGRELAYNDYQHSRGARGLRQDRNVILPTDRPPPPGS